VTESSAPADLIDFPRLRGERLARLQTSMRNQDVEACLLFHEPNIRYATGATAMPVWSMSTFVRCALVPVEGVPILFEHPNSIHRSRLAAEDVRPMHTWEFIDSAADEAAIWARETADAMRELGVEGGTVAVDRLATPGFEALTNAGIRAIDASPVTMRAREVKTPEEIRLFERNGEILSVMLAAFEDAIAPGVSERELLAVLAGGLLRRGGEYLATNTVCSGPNTNPWRAEATDRRIEAGDLVFVDTDAVGIGGCFFCVSRTFLCGDGEPTPAQRLIYRDAREWLDGVLELVRPGIACGELAAKAPELPDRYFDQRYECMIHGIGLEEESPSVCYPGDPQPNPDRVIEPGMMFVVELYAGEVGGTDGVKLGEEILVTPDGYRLLVPYPFDQRLS
jgi:Xaa-Pro dipeptidase